MLSLARQCAMRLYSSRASKRSTFAVYKLCESIAADATATTTTNHLTVGESVGVWTGLGALVAFCAHAVGGTDLTAVAVGTGVASFGAGVQVAVSRASRAEAEARLAVTLLMARDTLRHALSHNSRSSVAFRDIVPASGAMSDVSRNLYIGNKGVGFVRVCSTDDARHAHAVATITTTLKPIKNRAAVKRALKNVPAAKETTIDAELRGILMKP